MENNILDIDERTFQLAVRIIGMTRVLPAKEMASWVIGKQVIRSGTSINSNIIHAKSASSNKDLSHYLRIALAGNDSSGKVIGYRKNEFAYQRKR